jgi:hypothetical protein
MGVEEGAVEGVTGSTKPTSGVDVQPDKRMLARITLERATVWIEYFMGFSWLVSILIRVDLKFVILIL